MMGENMTLFLNFNLKQIKSKYSVSGYAILCMR